MKKNEISQKVTLRKAALKYHSQPTPGEIEVVSTKPCATQNDLSLAYTPGVAHPCPEVRSDLRDYLDGAR